MSSEVIVGIIIAVVIALSLVGKLIPKRQPKETYFKCARCGTAALHTDRTIEAWRNNKTKFFCQTCHAKWLRSRPQQEHASFSSSGSSKSGCLGVILLFAVVPLVGFHLVQIYA